jgi:hypothetical protein
MDSTNLDDLLGNGPVQTPAFAPMVTGGGDPFISPINTNPQKPNAPDYSRQFSILRGSIRGVLTYVAYFLAATLISLSAPRTLILQYMPNAYTSGGVVSYTGAAVLGVAAVVISYVISTVFYALF